MRIKSIHSPKENKQRSQNKIPKRKRTNNDIQNITQETKDCATQTPLKPGVNIGALEVLAVPAPLVTPDVCYC